MDDNLPRLNWSSVDVDEGQTGALAAELGLPRAVASVLVARGYADTDDAKHFLNPRLSALSDPLQMPGVPAAVSRIEQALENGEKIAVYGDYDVDGVTGTALVVQVLQTLGAKVKAFIPERNRDGYGFGVAPLKRCLARINPGLIITVDCGSNDVEAVREAQAAGVDVIVTDHHEVSQPAPARALVNPKLGDSEDVKSLAGVGVAFKLCHALVKAGLEDEWPELATLDLRDYLDLVAVGTVADVVPLTGENRTLVRHGLERLNGDPSAGLRALKDLAKVRSRVTGYHVGFLIGPRINAAGRIETADLALDLLLERDPRHARELASRLDSLNRERKRIEDEILAAAVEQLGNRPKCSPGGIVVGDEAWHLGTIGIVASRLSGSYRVPSVVIGSNGSGTCRGSCRSVDAIDILSVLEECADLLTTFGGHRMAAGLSIEPGQIEAFRLRFDQACAARLDGADLRQKLTVDAWISLGEADYTLLRAVDQLRPLGLGNPTPIWGVRGVRPVGPPRVVGKKMEHLKLTVASGGSQMDAIAFNMGDVRLPEGDLDMIFQLQENTYLGRNKLQLNVKDLCSSPR